MCGAHGIHRLISLAATETAPAGSLTTGLRSQTSGGSVDVENEVKLMFARGEIGTEAFQRLRVMAQSRELSTQDLKGFAAANRVNQRDQTDRAKKPVDESVQVFRRQLQTRYVDLAAACIETEESLHRLQLEAAALYQEAESMDLNSERKAGTRSRAISAEQRIDLIRERLGHLKASLADVVTQQRLIED